jgi:hypothetical protein
MRRPQRSKLISRLHAILRLDESRQRAKLRRHASAERSGEPPRIPVSWLRSPAILIAKPKERGRE